MAAAGSQHKIRQLAIVLSNLDGPASTRILASLPPQMTIAIRQQIQTLGAVSAGEREAAFDVLRPILKAASVSAPKPQPPRSVVHDERSPAEQLLAGGFQQQDYADIGYAAKSHETHTQANTASRSSTATELAINWNDATGKLWAELLQTERPILIATVVAHAPEHLACEILQELPSSVALETLASMPKIGTTELTILTEIAGQLNARLQSLGQRSTSGGWGLQRAKGIVETLPSNVRQQWVKQLESIDEGVARELTVISQSDVADATLAASSGTLQLNIAEHTRIDAAMSDTYSLNTNSDSGHAGGNPAEIIAYDAEDFEGLLKLSRSDLARVMRRCSPDIVLIALSGASRKWVTRFESLIHPKAHERLRQRLKALGTTPLKQVDQAQASIVAVAVEMRLVEAPRDVIAA